MVEFLTSAPKTAARHVVFTLVTVSAFSVVDNFLDDVKEWSGPFFDAQQLGVRLNFNVDVKILLSLT